MFKVTVMTDQGGAFWCYFDSLPSPEALKVELTRQIRELWASSESDLLEGTDMAEIERKAHEAVDSIHGYTIDKVHVASSMYTSLSPEPWPESAGEREVEDLRKFAPELECREEP